MLHSRRTAINCALRAKWHSHTSEVSVCERGLLCNEFRFPAKVLLMVNGAHGGHLTLPTKERMPLLKSIINYFGGTNSDAVDQEEQEQNQPLNKNSVSNNDFGKQEIQDPGKLSEECSNEMLLPSGGNEVKNGETVTNVKEILIEHPYSPGKENNHENNNEDDSNLRRAQTEKSVPKDTLANMDDKHRDIDIDNSEQAHLNSSGYPVKETDINDDVMEPDNNDIARRRLEDLDTSDNFFDAVGEHHLGTLTGDQQQSSQTTSKKGSNGNISVEKSENSSSLNADGDNIGEFSHIDKTVSISIHCIKTYGNSLSSNDDVDDECQMDTEMGEDKDCELSSLNDADNIAMDVAESRGINGSELMSKSETQVVKTESDYNEMVNSNGVIETASIDSECLQKDLRECENQSGSQVETNQAGSSGFDLKKLNSLSSKDSPITGTLPVSDSKSNLSVLDETSNLSSISTNSNITQKMIDEEEQYVKEDEELKHMKGKGIQELEAAPEDQRFDRLKNLLDRSNVYAQFLLQRMDQQREDEKGRRKKKVKAQEKRAVNAAMKKEEKNTATLSSQESPGASLSLRNKNERKRKREDGVESQESNQKEVAKKASKKRKTGECNDDEQVVPEFEEEAVAETKQKAKDNSEKDVKDTIGRTINGEIVSERQPSLVTGGVLRSYQLEGMEWLRGLFENGINGILADEMGLGKTLQCISLLAYLVERGIRGPFLIAAPLSTLSNWMSEFKKFSPKIPTLLYHGSKEERQDMRTKITRMFRIDDKVKLRSYPVVITSYEIIMRDRSDLYQLPWKYVIIDEGHRIKNLNCRLIRELKTYKTANRLLLTGTPLQNNLAELWSLLNFLLPDIFDDLNSFQEWFDFSAVEEDGGHEKIIAQEQEAHVLETLHAILTPFLLRRLKTDVDLSIPPKRELIVYAPMTKEQQEYYKGTLDKTILDKIRKKKTPVEPVEYTNSGRPKRKTTKDVKYKSIYENDDDSDDFDFDNLLEKVEAEAERKQDALTSKAKKLNGSVVSIKMQNILMQLRKCCNHPYLLEYPLDPTTEDYRIDEDIIKVSGKLRVLDRMLAELKKRGHKVLIFSQMTSMLDIIQDFCYWRSYGFSRLDGTMKIPERQEMIEKFNNDPEVFLFLLSTRAGGLGINLSSADTCIIYDSDWNPQADLQAQDRCHRIGQTKPVLIFRLVTANTVDETVVERAASKRKLEKMVIHKGRFKGRQVSNKLSPQELLDLLKSKDHGQFSGIGDDNVITDECLDKLLDRSFFCPDKDSGTVSSQSEDNEIFKVVENEKSDALF